MDFSHYKQAFSSSPEETCLHELSQSLGQSQVLTADCPCTLRRHRDCLLTPPQAGGCLLPLRQEQSCIIFTVQGLDKPFVALATQPCGKVEYLLSRVKLLSLI